MTPADDWIARERALAEQREREERQRRESWDREFDKRMARIRAHGCVDPEHPDLGCIFCRVVLTWDSQGRPMHPDNECRGAEPKPCEECRTRCVWNVTRRAWEPGCSPAEHDSLRSTRRIVQQVRAAEAGVDPLALGRAARQRD